MSDPAPWIAALRQSGDGLAALVAGLGPVELEGPSYCSEWSIAELLSHLGSQAEIFSLLLDAGLEGSEAPGPAEFGPIWERWNAKSPTAQGADSLAVNAALTERLEDLDEDRLASVQVKAFGMDLDVTAMCGLRLSEHAVHAWDLAVMLDPSATVLGDAVALLVDVLPMRVARLGTAATDPIRLAVTTQHPKRHLVLDTGGVSLEPSPGQSNGVAAGRGEAASDPTGGASIELDAEALLRLVYGRLDPAHTPPLQLEGVALDDLRAVFQPGGGR